MAKNAKMTPGEIADFKARLLGLVGNDSISIAKDDEYAAALEAELSGQALPESTGAAYFLDLIKLIEAGPKKAEPKSAVKKLEPAPAPVEEVKVEEVKAEEPKAEEVKPEEPAAPEVKVEEVVVPEVKAEEPKKADKPAKGKKADKDEDKSDKS